MARWTTLASAEACGSDNCPALHRSEDGRLYVQGRRASDDLREALALGADEDVLEIPKDLVAALRSLEPDEAQ